MSIDVNKAPRLRRLLLRLLPVLFLAGASAEALAGSADLEGTLSYRIDGDRITVEIERIANNGDATTGTLYLTVWMTASSNLFTSGYRAARHRFTGSSDGTLEPGQYFSDVRLTLAYQRPPPGRYYLHFYTSQHPEPNRVLDSHTFTSTVEVKEPGGPADIEGRIAYSISGNQMTVEIARIVNKTETTTGTLYVTVRMTTERNVRASGHRVARHRITGSSNGTLGPGEYFSDVRWTLDYQEPPRGRYYVHFYTSQHPEPNTVLDWRTFLSTLDIGDGVGGDDNHGNSRSTATRIALPSTTSGAIDPGNDTDYFRFVVSARGTIVMESTGELDTIGTLFDARGSRIVQDDDGAGYPNFRIERTLDAATYYVRVHSYGTATGSYTLHLHTGDGGGGDDHGNSRPSATHVALPSTTSGVINYGNDTDYFRFVLPARDTVTMESSGELDTIGTLFEASGSRIVQDDDGAGYPNFRIQRTLDAGTYYVRVHSYQTATGRYTLHLRTGDDGGGGGDGGDDHGNTRSAATLVALPSTTSGVIDPGNDTDYFRIVLSAKGTVVMESSGELDTIGTLFDASGSRIVQDDDSAGYPNFRIERTLDAGTYYVRVHSYQTATGAYALHLRTGDGGDGGGGGDDHGNTRSAATLVALPSTTSGVIDPGNDTDYFRFVLSARGTVVMESSGELDTIGTLFDARGTRIVQDDDGAGYPNFRIERTLDQGTYYVRVHSFRTTTGDYTLHLRTGP